MTSHARRPAKPPHLADARSRRRPAVVVLALLVAAAVIAPLVAMALLAPAQAQVVVAATPAAVPASSAAPAHAASRALPERGRLASAKLRHLVVDGVDRSYLVQPLPGARGAGRLPVVVLLHGASQNAQDTWRDTSLPTLGERDGFLVVAPQAVDKRWNEGHAASGIAPPPVDDVRFLKAVMADVIAQDHGDPSAVFMVGVSTGGVMAMRFACDAGESLRAAASLLATLPVALAHDCKSPRPLPWLAINGTDDPLAPFAGQPEGAARHGEPQPALESAEDSFHFWADRAGCTSADVREPLTDAAADEHHRWAERVRRAGCVAGHVSSLVVMHGSGHVVPGQAPETRQLERAAGPGAPELDAGTLVWDFFDTTLMK